MRYGKQNKTIPGESRYQTRDAFVEIIPFSRRREIKRDCVSTTNVS